MRRINYLLILLSLTAPFLLCAQVESVFNDIRMKDPLQTVAQKLEDVSEDTRIISVEDPRFPLALKQEEHLVCTNVKTDLGLISRVVFTFADDRLEYILSEGNVVSVFAEKRKDTSMVYMDYEVYFTDKLFLNKKKDLAWILTEEASHPNLFTWVNPYIDPEFQPDAQSIYSTRIPSFLEMGSSLDEMKPVLEKHSEFTYTQELDGSDPNAQVQVDCFGVEYLGFPRKVEARFGDNKLNVVWILTGKGDEERIRKALIDEYGQPIYVNEDWEIFHDWQVGLRKDKPEVLLMEKSIGLYYKTSYFKQ